MNEPLPDILSAEWAWQNFREDVLQLIVWGYQDAEAEIRRREMEEDITGLIRRSINDKLDEEELPLRFRMYSAKGEDHVDDAGKLGKQRPRVDILIESGVGRLPRKRYRFEAKRCARKRFNSKYKIEWYAEGITEFVTGTYALNAPEAGMLGLMQSDDALYWKGELSTHLSTDATLACNSALTDVNLPADIPNVSVSQHRRHDESLIDLYHVFLDCTSSYPMLPPEKQTRLDTLMTRNNAGSLTDVERSELQSLVREAEDLTLANSRLLAQQRQRLESVSAGADRAA